MKYRSILYIIFLMVIAPLLALGQDIKTLKGKVSFSSALPTRLVDATSELLLVKYDTIHNKLSFKVPVSSFHFSNCSREVEKYFNDLYMESHRYHWASFEGKVADSTFKVSAAKTRLKVLGRLTIHGVTQNIEVMGFIYQSKPGIVTIESSFKVLLKDYKINILADDVTRLAEDIHIHVTADLKK